MVMDPRTHPRGAPPDFELPKPNPAPSVMTDALWWLVCMRMALHPESRNGGTYAPKPGSHNLGANLPDHGQDDPRTDHSIRHEWNRAGPWWRTKCAAHDWTFNNAHSGDYSTISMFTKRLITAMRDPDDLRPDQVVFYTLGQADADRVVEGYHELHNDDLPSADLSHLFHRHDSFFRNIIGDFDAMWKVLTIDMGWTYTEWQQSVTPQREDDMNRSETLAFLRSPEAQAELAKAAGKGVHDQVVGKTTSTLSQLLQRLEAAEATQRARDEAILRAAAGADDGAAIIARLGDLEGRFLHLLGGLPAAVVEALPDHVDPATAAMVEQAVTRGLRSTLGSLDEAA